MESKPKIAVIIGTTREGRFGDTIARWFMGVASAREDMEFELLDLRDYSLPFLTEPVPPAAGKVDPAAETWAAKIESADGFVMLTPEYNRGYPAVLKNAIDHLYQQWNTKAIGFVSYGGGAGGARAVEQLRLVAIEMQMAPIREGVVIPMARMAFDESGQPTNPTLNDRATSMLNQLAWWTTALRAARVR